VSKGYHLPTGHLLVARRVFASIKHPHLEHTLFFLCSHKLHISKRVLSASGLAKGMPAFAQVKIESPRFLTFWQAEQLKMDLFQRMLLW